MNAISTIQTATTRRVESARPQRILLAEDTPISAEAMKAMAQRFAIKMDIASNGYEAIEMVEAANAQSQPYSLILIDVMMPILDGVETTRRLRKLGYDADTLPIIAVTAATSLDEIRSYRECGMQAFLAKPVTLAELRAALDAWGNTDTSLESTETQNSGGKIEPVLLEALAHQFSDRNADTLKQIEIALETGDFSNRTINEIINLFHQIAGTASTFGNCKLSETARIYENALIATRLDENGLKECLRQAAQSLKIGIEM